MIVFVEIDKMSNKRNSYLQGWFMYPVEMLSHHVQGLLAALAILLGGTALVVVGVLWTLMYITYQGFTRIRKEDSAGLDVNDYMVGFGIGLVLALIFPDTGSHLLDLVQAGR